MKCAHLESDHEGKDTLLYILEARSLSEEKKHIHHKVKCAHLVPEPNSR